MSGRWCSPQNRLTETAVVAYFFVIAVSLLVQIVCPNTPTLMTVEDENVTAPWNRGLFENPKVIHLVKVLLMFHGI